MKYLLDSSALVSLLRGHECTVARLKALPRPDRTYVSSVCYAELMRGVFSLPKAADQVREREKLSAVLARLHGMLAPGQGDDGVAEVAEEWGRIAALLRKQGQPIGANDTWIAVTALVHDLVLVSEDAHFARVPGLKVENWAAKPEV